MLLVWKQIWYCDSAYFLRGCTTSFAHGGINRAQNCNTHHPLHFISLTIDSNLCLIMPLFKFFSVTSAVVDSCHVHHSVAYSLCHMWFFIFAFVGCSFAPHLINHVHLHPFSPFVPDTHPFLSSFKGFNKPVWCARPNSRFIFFWFADILWTLIPSFTLSLI